MSINAGSSLTTGEAPPHVEASSPVIGADYDGTSPFAEGEGLPGSFEGRVRAGVTATIVGVPFAGLGVAVWLGWGRGLPLLSLDALPPWKAGRGSATFSSRRACESPSCPRLRVALESTNP